MTAQPNGSGSGGGVINQVALTYNAFGQLVQDSQSHAGVVIDTTPAVQYGYADGTDNDIRLLSITYPNGRVITLVYDFEELDEGLQRVDQILDSGEHIIRYAYLGLNTQVNRTYDAPQLEMDLVGGTVGEYAGLDRFNRIIDLDWSGNGPGSNTAFTYGYDRNSNRLYRGDTVARLMNKNFDELYAYDGLNRLVDMKRGLLNSTKTGLQSGTENFEQSWSLDPVGNWKAFSEDDTGSGTFNLVQQRNNNMVNEITGITETTGPSWVTPTYDPAGNTISFPQGSDPTQTYQAVYDAWNRLVKVIIAGTTHYAAQYAYDARNYRITRLVYNESGAYQNTLEDYLSNRWQVLETRKWTSQDPTTPATVYEQYIWGHSTGGYVDELNLRDRDTDGDGTLDEEIYVVQDANYNVAAVSSDVQGMVGERYVYTPYGERGILDGSYNNRSMSIYAWHFGHQGLFYELSGGIIYNRNRMMNSGLGRFLQVDPLGYVDTCNLFEYQQGNPPSLQDPNGTDSSTDPCETTPVDQWQDPTTIICKGYTGIAKWCCEQYVKRLLPQPDGCAAALHACQTECANAFANCPKQKYEECQAACLVHFCQMHRNRKKVEFLSKYKRIA